MPWTSPAFSLSPPSSFLLLLLLLLHSPTYPVFLLLMDSDVPISILDLIDNRLKSRFCRPTASDGRFAGQLITNFPIKFHNSLTLNHLLKKLSTKDIDGEAVEQVVGICTEIFSTFLHTDYGGPGTLPVIPFIDMADRVNERGLPGGSQAARAAVKWHKTM